MNKILSAKKQPPSSPFSKGEFKEVDTSAMEKKIGQMVYNLYGLAEDEMRILEGKG